MNERKKGKKDTNKETYEKYANTPVAVKTSQVHRSQDFTWSAKESVSWLIFRPKSVLIVEVNRQHTQEKGHDADVVYEEKAGYLHC